MLFQAHLCLAGVILLSIQFSNSFCALWDSQNPSQIMNWVVAMVKRLSAQQKCLFSSVLECQSHNITCLWAKSKSGRSWVSPSLV